MRDYEDSYRETLSISDEEPRCSVSLHLLRSKVFDQSLEENEAMRYTERAMLALELTLGQKLAADSLISVEELRSASAAARSGEVGSVSASHNHTMLA